MAKKKEQGYVSNCGGIELKKPLKKIASTQKNTKNNKGNK